MFSELLNSCCVAHTFRMLLEEILDTVAKLINFVPKLKLFVGTTLEIELRAEVACASSFVFTGSLH